MHEARKSSQNSYITNPKMAAGQKSDQFHNSWWDNKDKLKARHREMKTSRSVDFMGLLRQTHKYTALLLQPRLGRNLLQLTINPRGRPYNRWFIILLADLTGRVISIIEGDCDSIKETVLGALQSRAGYQRTIFRKQGYTDSDQQKVLMATGH